MSVVKFFENFSNPIMFLLENDFCKFTISELMSEQGKFVREGRTLGDPTPPMVPLDAGPGHQAQQLYEPLDYDFLDQVDEGVQRLAVACLSPWSQRIKDLEAMVQTQNARFRTTINEAQGLIDKANMEARALQREKDEAGWHTSAEIMVADDLSKNFDTSEYKLSRNDFGMLSQKFGPFCLDLFASPSSYLFKPFCSRFLCKEAVAVDAFTIDWSSLTNGFFHPPVGLVTRVLKHAQYVKAEGVLIVPVWESADFWPVIVRLVRNEQAVRAQ